MIVKRNDAETRRAQRGLRSRMVAQRAQIVQPYVEDRMADQTGRGPRDIGKRIETARMALGLTQEQFARGVKKKQSACAGWESGQRPPGLKAAQQLCDTYHLTLDYLFRGDMSAIPQGLLLKINAMKRDE